MAQGTAGLFIQIKSWLPQGLRISVGGQEAKSYSRTSFRETDLPKHTDSGVTGASAMMLIYSHTAERMHQPSSLEGPAVQRGWACFPCKETCTGSYFVYSTRRYRALMENKLFSFCRGPVGLAWVFLFLFFLVMLWSTLQSFLRNSLIKKIFLASFPLEVLISGL